MPVIRTATLEGAAKAGGHSSKTIGRGWVVESANSVRFRSLVKVLYTTHARVAARKLLATSAHFPTQMSRVLVLAYTQSPACRSLPLRPLFVVRFFGLQVMMRRTVRQCLLRNV